MKFSLFQSISLKALVIKCVSHGTCQKKIILPNIVIYKAVFNNFDEVLPIPINGVRKVLFSDRPLEVDGWDTVVLHCEDAILENRKLKMFPWKYLDEDFSIYLDGRLDITPTFFEFLLKKNLRDKLLVPMHRSRGNVQMR